MNDEERKEYIDDVQKDITKVCFNLCFNKKDQQCLQKCYQDYLKTIKKVFQVVKKLGYDNHSVYAYKAFPKLTPEFDMYYTKRWIRIHRFTPFNFVYDHVSQKLV
ncbi:hypothetical protein pb186bvf_014015 [Paramecium bursaria]